MDTLPSEIKKIIVAYLDDRSRRIMRLANTDWFNKIQYSNFIFNFTTEERIPQLVQRLAKYNHPLSVVFEKSKCTLSAKDYEDIGRLTHLTKFVFGSIRNGSDPDSVLDPLTNLTNLKRITHNLPKSIVKHLTNLQHVCLNSINEVQNLDLARFSKLRSLTWGLDGYEISAKDFLSITPHATAISYLFISISEAQRQAMDETNLTKFHSLNQLHLYSSHCSFNLPCLPNLEVLFLYTKRIGGLAQLQKLTSLELYGTTDFTELASLTKLQMLDINWTENDLAIENLQFLTALTNLESFKLSLWLDEDDQTYEAWSTGLEFISSKKLTELEYPFVQTDIITKFGNLLSLKCLKCDHAVVEQLLHLTHLCIESAEPEVLLAVEKLTNLKSLELDLARVPNNSKVSLQIGKLSALKRLYFKIPSTLKVNELIDFNNIQHLSLEALNVAGIDDSLLEKISMITTLQSLTSHKSTLSDDNSIQHLTNMTNLTYLILKHTNLTGEHLTLLTSLQRVIFTRKNGEVLDEQVLKQKLPRLYELTL